MIYFANYGFRTLTKEFEYYTSHQKELVGKIRGKIRCDKKIKKLSAHMNPRLRAYEEAQKEHELGTFLIQHVEPGVENYTQTFYSRVSI